MIPTSLLAMVDSSIGGKTGINSKFGKNLIGTFYLPKKVFICSDFLKSLPKREIACGYAEIIKYSLIHSKQLHKLLYKGSKGDIDKIIKLSINSKFKYISDFREKLKSKNSRAILNFGHTIGHAIENSNFYKGNLKHGEAISLGMIVELPQSSILPSSLKLKSLTNLMTSSSSSIKKPVLKHLGHLLSLTSSMLLHALSDTMSIQITCTNLYGIFFNLFIINQPQSRVFMPALYDEV